MAKPTVILKLIVAPNNISYDIVSATVDGASILDEEATPRVKGVQTFTVDPCLLPTGNFTTSVGLNVVIRKVQRPFSAGLYAWSSNFVTDPVCNPVLYERVAIATTDDADAKTGDIALSGDFDAFKTKPKANL